MKTTIDPRMLENILSSGYFPHVTDWGTWMLRRRNQGKRLFFQGKDHDALWGRVILSCIIFESYFGFDPRSQKYSYEYLLEHVRNILQRLVHEIVSREDEEKRLGKVSHGNQTLLEVYKAQFKFWYDNAVEFFGHDLNGSQGYTPFFKFAEAHLKRMKNGHNAKESVR